jgi:hypothetical protein
MFCPMKEALRERRFSSDEEFTDSVQNWLKTQQRTFCSFGIKKTFETLEQLPLSRRGLR